MLKCIIVIFCYSWAQCLAAVEEFDNFSVNIKNPLTKNEKKLFEPVKNLKGEPIGIRFIKKGVFRGLSCDKGVELRNEIDAIRVYSPDEDNSQNRIICLYNNLPLIRITFNTDFSVQSYKTVDKDLFSDAIEVIPVAEAEQGKILKNVGINDASFYPVDNGSIMRKNFLMYGQTFPKGTYIIGSDPDDSGNTHVTLRNYLKNKSISFRGTACEQLETYSSPYISCLLSGPILLNGVKFLRGSEAIFLKNDNSNTPLFIKNFGQILNVDGKKVKSGDIVKVDGKKIKYIGYMDLNTSPVDGNSSY